MCEIAQDGIETQLTLYQSDILLQSYHHSWHTEKRFLRIYFSYMPLATKVLNSWDELCISVYVAAGCSPLKCSTHWVEHIYCHPIYIYIYIYIYIEREREEKWIESDRMYVEKGKNRRKICLMVCLFASTFWLQGFVWIQKYLTKLFLYKYNYNSWIFFILLEAFIRACRCCYVKNGVILYYSVFHIATSTKPWWRLPTE